MNCLTSRAQLRLAHLQPETGRRHRRTGGGLGTGGPDVEIEVRTTGLLTAGRNPGGGTGPVRQLLTTEGNNVPFEG